MNRQLSKIHFIFCLVLGIMISSTGNTQVKTTDEKIIEFFGTVEQFEMQKQNNPGLILFLQTRVTKGFAIMEYNEERHLDAVLMDDFQIKSGGIETTISSIELMQMFEQGILNILLLKIDISQKEDVIIKLAGTEFVLVLYSVDHINGLLQK
ncbi:MAG: hypothetical protein IPM74_15475 [Crocinitomicaceae bacterium]|nr:hypothetical protein [Crocinitomicaceae bacterium]MBK8927270.1 hypothetical protein [Crocinitomicaceae bacterium]